MELIAAGTNPTGAAGAATAGANPGTHMRQATWQSLATAGSLGATRQGPATAGTLMHGPKAAGTLIRLGAYRHGLGANRHGLHGMAIRVANR